MLEQFEKYINTGNQDGMITLGGEVHHWKVETEGKLEKQLIWLEANNGNPKQDERFRQWFDLMWEYQKACNLLDQAKELL